MGRDTLSDPELWERLDKFAIEDLGETVFFSKLTSENRWSGKTARQAIREYKKFMYLAALTEDRLSPPRAVDRVWHIHLTFTRNYWEEFCPNILGKSVHHDPSPPTREARSRDKEDQKKAQNLYAREFGAKPPRGLWTKGYRKALAKAGLGIGALALGFSIFGSLPFSVPIIILIASLIAHSADETSVTFSLGDSDGDLFHNTACGSCGSSGDGDGCGGGCGD